MRRVLSSSSLFVLANTFSKAKRLFITHLATVDTTAGPVTAEIIPFHLVQDMKSAFNKYVKEYGCT
jgi:hypothetical protein